MKKKEMNYYFQTFVKLFEFANQAALYLEKVVLNFNDGITEEQKDEMHAIEHGADLCLHDALDKLAKEFITPIENEDILAIIKAIDDATDVIEETLIRMYIHNIKTLPDAAIEFTSIIKRECFILFLTEVIHNLHHSLADSVSLLRRGSLRVYANDGLGITLA